jgi:hypothetical protein
LGRQQGSSPQHPGIGPKAMTIFIGLVASF